MENYQEIQKFRQWWLWAIIIIMPILTISLIYFDENKSINEIIITWVIFLPFIWFFYVLKLKTTITNQGITLSLKPFLLNHKFISFEDIQEIKKVNYNPIIACGGWGLRWYKNGMAYTVSGNQGIEILLKNNDLLLIGTQKPEAFIASIEVFNVIK